MIPITIELPAKELLVDSVSNFGVSLGSRLLVSYKGKYSDFSDHENKYKLVLIDSSLDRWRPIHFSRMFNFNYSTSKLGCLQHLHLFSSRLSQFDNQAETEIASAYQGDESLALKAYQSFDGITVELRCCLSKNRLQSIEFKIVGDKIVYGKRQRARLRLLSPTTTTN